MVATKKLAIITLIICIFLTFTACSNTGTKITYDGGVCKYNGKTYVLHPGLKVLHYNNKIGETGEAGNIVEFYEIQGMNKDSWLGIRNPGFSDLFVLKENSVPWISIKDFNPKEIRSESDTVKIKDKKVINQLIDIIGTKGQETIDFGDKVSEEYHLFSDKYPNLIYVIYYYKMDNGKKYIVDYSNNHTTGATYDIGDLVLN